MNTEQEQPPGVIRFLSSRDLPHLERGRLSRGGEGRRHTSKWTSKGQNNRARLMNLRPIPLPRPPYHADQVVIKPKISTTRRPDDNHALGRDIGDLLPEAIKKTLYAQVSTSPDALLVGPTEQPPKDQSPKPTAD